jgi:DNA helicase-2/ATP-dependent DNA helicase PcrA
VLFRSALVGEVQAANLWMDTFHSIFSKILHVEAEHLGYSSNFTIYDAQDSRNLIKRVIKELHLDDKLYKPHDVLGRISMAKNTLITSQAYARSANIQAADKAVKKPMISEIYKYYEGHCKQSNVMDFDDLLLQTNILFRDFPEVLDKYQRKFEYILVDEYQDTNYSQYLIIKRLAELHHNVCVVGDDAQSIYSFRGARIENILNFKNDYPDYTLYKLEQNYRSTTNIVEAANSVIARNKEQIPKQLFSRNEEGEKIRVIKTLTEWEEAYQVVNEIYRGALAGRQSYDHFAILYRTNAQSRLFEEALRKLNIPYKIYGGHSFYQRKEIKDLLAYLRLAVNPDDEESLRRVINYPRRGIGETTIDRLRELAARHGGGLWMALDLLKSYPGALPSGTAGKLARFKEIVDEFVEMARADTAYNVARYIANASGIVADLAADDSPEGVSRKENIQELLNAVKEFSETAYKEGREDTLALFLAGVALLTDQDNEKGDNTPKVALMTVHSAKGLEFPTVFLVGIEEELFPAAQSIYSPSALEEERRLFYVALTRAEKRLVLSHAISRRRNGESTSPRPSRFIGEIDPRYIQGYTPRAVPAPARPVTRPPVTIPAAPVEMTEIDATRVEPLPVEEVVPGLVIYHPVFGTGKVIAIDGLGMNRKANVYFSRHGTKLLLLKFAKIYTQRE